MNIQNDPVRQHQTAVSEVSLLLPEHCEATIKVDYKKYGLVFAPGEDQRPQSALK